MTTRRNFLKNTTMLAAGLGVSPLLSSSPLRSYQKEEVINGKVRIAVIGVGMGCRDLQGALTDNPWVHCVGMCDVNKVRLEEQLARFKKDFPEQTVSIKAYTDFRRCETRPAGRGASWRRGYSDSYAGAPARSDRTGVRRTRRDYAFRAGRSRPDARHGIRRRHQTSAAATAEVAPDPLFFGDDACGHRGALEKYADRPRAGGGDSGFVGGGCDRSAGLFRGEAGEEETARISAPRGG